MGDTGESSAGTLWAVTPEKIEEAVRRIVQAAHPLKVILFGSRARGEARPDSDVDLMVVEEETEDTSAEATRLYRCLRDLLMGVEIVVVAREKFEYWKDTPGNVYYEAAQDGRTLYEAA
ncbi:MAG: nucleotidyltransferase domain-containing protein [Candidatus Brocadiia bacterium]